MKKSALTIALFCFGVAAYAQSGNKDNPAAAPAPDNTSNQTFQQVSNSLSLDKNANTKTDVKDLTGNGSTNTSLKATAPEKEAAPTNTELSAVSQKISSGVKVTPPANVHPANKKPQPK